MFDFLRLCDEQRVKQHAVTVAAWIFQSGPGFFCTLFGSEGAANETLTAWVLRPSSEFSGLRATLALRSDEPVGVFVGLTGPEIPARRRADLLALLQQTSADRRSHLKQKLERLADLTSPVMDDDYYIRTVAVDATQRGQGIGRRIVEHALSEGHEAGFKRFRLDVDANNDAALTLYRSLGFETIYEGAASDFGLRMYSMLRTD